MKDKEKIEKIAREVKEEYKMGGLSEGLYLDFTTDVAIRYAKEEREKTIKECIAAAPKEIYVKRTEQEPTDDEKTYIEAYNQAISDFKQSLQDKLNYLNKTV